MKRAISFRMVPCEIFLDNGKVVWAKFGPRRSYGYTNRRRSWELMGRLIVPSKMSTVDWIKKALQDVCLLISLLHISLVLIANLQLCRTRFLPEQLYFVYYLYEKLNAEVRLHPKRLRIISVIVVDLLVVLFVLNSAFPDGCFCEILAEENCYCNSFRRAVERMLILIGVN